MLMSPPTGLVQHCGRLGQTVLSLNRSVAQTTLAHALEHKTWDRRGGLGKNRGPVWGGRESTGGRSGLGVGFGTAKDLKSPCCFLMETIEEHSPSALPFTQFHAFVSLEWEAEPLSFSLDSLMISLAVEWTSIGRN